MSLAPTFAMPASGQPTPEMLQFFRDQGYIVLTGALPPAVTAELAAEISGLDADARSPEPGKTMCLRRARAALTKHHVFRRFFERSRAMVRVVRTEPLVDFAQALIADVPGGRGNALTAHLVHNNAFCVPPGGRGQAPSWHTDDALQHVIIQSGDPPLPAHVRLPVLAVTCMCWLSDVTAPEDGPTFVFPGSHRLGRPAEAALAESGARACCGHAGTAVIVNNQLWHRGAAVSGTRARVCMQMTFGRRMVGHKLGSIMDYQLPEHVRQDLQETDKPRFGFLEGGAYS